MSAHGACSGLLLPKLAQLVRLVMSARVVHAFSSEKLPSTDPLSPRSSARFHVVPHRLSLKRVQLHKFINISLMKAFNFCSPLHPCDFSLLCWFSQHAGGR